MSHGDLLHHKCNWASCYLATKPYTEDRPGSIHERAAVEFSSTKDTENESVSAKGNVAQSFCQHNHWKAKLYLKIWPRPQTKVSFYSLKKVCSIFYTLSIRPKKMQSEAEKWPTPCRFSRFSLCSVTWRKTQSLQLQLLLKLLHHRLTSQCWCRDCFVAHC